MEGSSVWNASSPVVQPVANRQIVLASNDELELKTARESLLRGLDDIVAAIKDNQSIQKKADKLGQKGWFASIGGVISGENDKDLASMVKALGGSLETTQAVVQVMLRLQSRKDKFLREFQSVLIDKLVNLQSDTKTLDTNQQAMALSIVSALQDQVDEQIRQYDLVDHHERSLKDLGDRLNRNDMVDEEFREALTVLGSQTSSLRSAERHLSNEIETLHSVLKDQADEQTRQRDLAAARHERSLKDIGDRFDDRANRQERTLKDISDRLYKAELAQEEFRQALEKSHTIMQQMQREFQADANKLSIELAQTYEQGNALQRSVDQLELVQGSRSTWTTRLQQQSIGIAGLVVALLAIVHSFAG